MFGRKEIQTSEIEVNSENVVRVLERAYMKHLVNRWQIEFLYNYYKGKQPILE